MTVLALGLFCAGLAWEGPAAAAEVADFSAGFERLVALGLPPLDERAVWVIVKVEDPYRVWDEESIKGFRGNAWSTDSGGERVIVGYGEVRPWEGVEPSAAEPELEKDVEALLRMIREEADEGYLGKLPGKAGTMLLFATQLYQTGHGDMANQVAHAIFEAVEPREQVLDQAVRAIADQAYGELADQFFEDGDWTAYHSGAAALVDKFSRGWGSRDAVSMLLRLLEQRIEGVEAPALSLPEVAISPRAAALAAEWLERTGRGASGVDKQMLEQIRQMPAKYRVSMLRGMYREDFALPQQWLIEEIPGAEDSPDPVSKMAALGTEALPALAALLGDTTLTHRRNTLGPSKGGLFYSNVDPDDKGPEEIFLTLDRPATRGEVARQLLQLALPDAEGNLRELADESLKSQALEFWRTHQDDSREELALAFLQDGSGEQQRGAAAVLAGAKEERYHRQFEEYILALEPAYVAVREVEAYLRARGGEAREFLDRFIALIRVQAPDSGEDDEEVMFDREAYLLQELGGVEGIIRRFSPLVSDKSVEEMALDIARGDPAEAGEAILALDAMLQDLDQAEYLRVVLTAARASAEPRVRAEWILSLGYRGRRNRVAGPGAPREIPEGEAEAWRALLADTAAIPETALSTENEGARRYLSQRLEAATIGDLACYMLERSLEAEPGLDRIAWSAAVLDQKPIELMREFAMARLDGKTPPSLPDANKVDELRFREIVDKAATLAPQEINVYYKTLTPDERLRWMNWIADPGDIELPDSVKALLWMVRGAPPVEQAFPWPARRKSSIKAGFMSTPENLLELFRSYAKNPDEASPGIVSLSVVDNAYGLFVSEAKIDLAMKPDEGEEGGDTANSFENRDPNWWRSPFDRCVEILEEDPDIGLVVEFHLNESHVAWIWFGGDGKVHASVGEEGEPSSEVLPVLQAVFDAAKTPRGAYWLVLARQHLKILTDDPENSDQE